MTLLTNKSEQDDYSQPTAVLQDNREKKRSNNVSPSRSKKVSRVRRSNAKDTRILQRIEAFPVPSDGVSSSVAHSTPPHTPLTPSTNHHIPVWAHTGDRVKAVFATGALLIADTPAVAFTFNLTDDAIERAKGHPAGFLDALKRPFDAHLKRAFGTVFPYWFAIDMNEEGRLHIHGAFLPPATTIRTVRKIRGTMKAAWGEWKGPGKRKQLRFKTLYSDDWATYCIRNQRKVGKLIGPRTFTVTQPLGQEAKSVYIEIRRIMRGRA
ncbi:hypothetical protein ACE10X_27225 [Bradyrhizobium sp. Pha-3]|uniref:hypothetical protein n=1 Tax=Bradyrhizobium sp. Pha-3 TaxID=208375 RepID=UPI0035D4B124